MKVGKLDFNYVGEDPSYHGDRIMWYTFVEASGLHRLVSNTTGGLQTQAFAACTCATTAPRLPRKSRGDLRCKIRSSVADLLIFKIQVKCGRRVAEDGRRIEIGNLRR
jgi:hypothetical protein